MISLTPEDPATTPATEETFTAEVCDSTDRLCEYVRELTGNEWLAGAANWLIAKPSAILLIVAIGLVARFLVNRFVDRLVKRATTGIEAQPGLGLGKMNRQSHTLTAEDRVAVARRRQRAETMGTVLKSIAAFTIFVVVTIMILAELGVNIGPLIAGAGIVGVALGFGAQSLVKDFLSGIFMLFEDQYGIGDIVDLGDATGTVEAVSLRVTRLRDVYGTVWYVRNGEILRVGNKSQNWARTVLDISVAYGEDLARVRTVLAEVAHELYEDEEFAGLMLEEPEVWGVEAMQADGISVRVAMKTAPSEQWKVARVLRERIKARFDTDGIEMPFPQRVIWHRGEVPADAATDTPTT